MLRLLQAAGREGGGTGAKGQERDPGSAEQAAEGEDGLRDTPHPATRGGLAGPQAGGSIPGPWPGTLPTWPRRGAFSPRACRGQCGTAGRTLLPHQISFPPHWPPNLFKPKLLRHTQPEPGSSDMDLVLCSGTPLPRAPGPGSARSAGLTPLSALSLPLTQILKVAVQPVLRFPRLVLI